MPEQIFDETHAKVADFLIQNSGNFRFSTSIQSDALTLSFHASPLPSLSSNDNTNSSSLSYSPIQWEDWTDEPDGPNVVDTNGLVPAADSQLCAGSQDSVGKLPTDHPSKDLLPNGSGVYVFEGVDLTSGEGESSHNSDWEQRLTGTMPIPNTHHPPNSTFSLGNASSFMPNVSLLLPNVPHSTNGTFSLGNASSFTPNVSLSLPNVSHSTNSTFSLGNTSSFTPNVSHLLSNVSHSTHGTHIAGNASSFMPNVSYLMALFLRTTRLLSRQTSLIRCPTSLIPPTALIMRATRLLSCPTSLTCLMALFFGQRIFFHAKRLSFAVQRLSFHPWHS
ncbi:hypothetical protein EV702DRAFT_1202744 [Suillus placidus]|uniref:Uncharacterized protein n=1 Tax=Suillus placidus TaxID=48579 RepID=A0A9P7CY30_9AGAM|nr:hypothetical protein EV702DRAFT_1202744 [Suillus placidus]